MGRIEYQPVALESSVTLDPLEPSTEEQLNLLSKHDNDQNWRSLDDIEVSDLSEDDEADDTMPYFPKQNQRWEEQGGFLAKLRTAASVVKTFIIRNRLGIIATGGESPPWYPSPHGGTLETWAHSYQKAQVMVQNMSLLEKVNVTTGVGWSMGLCVGNTGPAIDAGFPSLCLQDGPLGIRFADQITAFPAGLTTAATWNRTLFQERGYAVGKEARGKGVNVLLGPSMGPLGIAPAGGRNWEGFSPDPVLSGIAAADTIKGIQRTGVMATAKHFVLNEQEHFRQGREWVLPDAISSNIDDRALHEVFVWPFAESIRADVASVMCSYQMVNNSYACGNSKLLNGILKDELGFQGFVQSDWLAQRSGITSALAGLDMSMPGDGYAWADGDAFWGKQLTIAILNGTMPMDRLNDMVTRIVAAWYQLGQDEPGDNPTSPNFSSWTNEEYGHLYEGSGDKQMGKVNHFVNVQGSGDEAHSNTARRVAAEGTVLVKNEYGILPLNPQGVLSASRKPYRVGVFGEDAGPGKGPNACPDRGCNQGTLASGWGSGAVEFPYLVTPYDALKESFNASKVEVQGFLTNEITDKDLENHDLCLVFVNSDSGEGYLKWGDIRGDRNDLYLQKYGDELVQKVANNCGQDKGDTVVVIHAVGPVVLEDWIEHPRVKAVVLAHLPGEESGNALSDVLFGRVDASGRLPYTIGKSLEDYGESAQVLYFPNAVVPQVNFTDGLYIDYRYFDKHDITPRYEFGFGLSYTTFELSGLLISPVRDRSMLPAPRPQEPVQAPTYSDEKPDAKSALFPPGFRKLRKYIYPYLSDLSEIKQDYFEYPKDYHKKQPPSPAGGGLGGNPSLYETFVIVTANVTNTGNRTGQEVVQLYVSFPDNVVDSDDKFRDTIEFPVRVLRAFDKVELDPGETKKVEFLLTRKDLSFWSTRRQNWVMPVDGVFGIQVGRSSRDLPLRGEY
uniref:Probable beta-glucosidase E n=1 Tax=Talaromyces piceae TaxID=153982 RepID=A0A2D2AGU8_9EURO|nr:beta-glucosidase [Talaromyces piceae]